MFSSKNLRQDLSHRHATHIRSGSKHFACAGVPPPTRREAQTGVRKSPARVPASAGRSRVWRCSHLAGVSRRVQPVELPARPAIAGDVPTLDSPADDPQAEAALLAELSPYGARAPVTLGIGSGGASPRAAAQLEALLPETAMPCDTPKVGSFELDQLRAAAAGRGLGPRRSMCTARKIDCRLLPRSAAPAVPCARPAAVR